MVTLAVGTLEAKKKKNESRGQIMLFLCFPSMFQCVMQVLCLPHQRQMFLPQKVLLLKCLLSAPASFSPTRLHQHVTYMHNVCKSGWFHISQTNNEQLPNTPPYLTNQLTSQSNLHVSCSSSKNSRNKTIHLYTTWALTNQQHHKL